MRDGEPIPRKRNLAMLAVASSVCAVSLYAASHGGTLGMLAGAIAFALAGNTIFSLLHEAVHGVFHDRRAVNDAAGRLAAAWFPTGFTLQRAFHLTHHRNNRSRFEQFDVMHDGDVKWLKHAQWYAILTGVYWAFAALGALSYLVIPRVLRLRALRDEDSKTAEQTSSRAYFAALDEIDPVRARLEIVFSIAFQIALVFALDLSVGGWLACYAAFGFLWSSLQYADHAFSPLDAREGAWNLRTNPIVRAIFLNYHFHLAHHRSPKTPWIHLPRHVVPGEPMPAYASVWWAMWRGPQPIERVARPPFSLHSEPLVRVPRGVDAWLAAILALAFVVLFLAFYGGASALSGSMPYRIEVDLPFERTLPFVPEAALVYLSMDLLVALAAFVIRDRAALVGYIAALSLETIVASIFFVLLPVETNFPAREATGVFGAFFGAADAMNLERNFLPSLHVAFAFTAAFALGSRARGLPRVFFYAWAIAISASTVLIHEHHLLDIAAGIGLAFVAYRVCSRWFARAEVADAIEIEILCFADFARFTRRHIRYGLIALALTHASLFRWRERRLLRTGFAFLQHVDDLLDGDRRCDREPLEVTGEVVRAIETGDFGTSDLMQLARAFAADLRSAGGAAAIAQAIRLVRVMQRDRRRVLDGTRLTASELAAHHDETFTLSIDLMLLAGGGELRSSDVPELPGAFGWCSTVRDLREDLAAGLVNVPSEILDACSVERLDLDELAREPAFIRWMEQERLRALALLERTDRRLEALRDRRGASVLRMFARSIRKYANRPAPTPRPTAPATLVRSTNP